MPLDPQLPLMVTGAQPQAPISPMQTIGALMQLRGQASEIALRNAQAQRAAAQEANFQAQEEDRQRKLKDQNNLQKIVKDTLLGGGTWDDAFDKASKSGIVSPDTVINAKTNYAKFVEQGAKTDFETLKTHNEALKSLTGPVQQILDNVPPENRQSQYQSLLQNSANSDNPVIRQMVNQAPRTWDDEAMRELIAQSIGSQQVVENSMKRQEAEQKSAVFSLDQQKKQLDITKAEQETTGTQPISPYQQAQLDKGPADRNPTEASLAMQVAAGKAPGATPEQVAAGAAADAALKRLDQSKLAARPQISVTSATDSDVKETAKAIEQGRANPVLSNYSFRDRTKLAAELSRAGYDQATAERDWKAIQRHLSTLNGAQQERLRQAITFTSDSLDNIENLYAEWQKVGPASGFKILNKAALAAAKQSPGRAGEVATSLDAQIADLTSELGTVYKGGNASTDETLRLASKNLSGDWNEGTFKEAIKNIRKNLAIRKNSVMTSEPAGVSPNSPYNPPSEHPAPAKGYQDYLKAIGAGK